MRTSFSQLNKFETCPRQYAFHYVDRYRPEMEPANLIFGGRLHGALTGFIAGHAEGMVTDPGAVFAQKWDEAMAEKQISFSSTQTPESLRATGVALCKQFPSFWSNSGLTALIGPTGEPMVELKLEMRIPGGHIHQGYVDTIAATPDGEAAIIDLKTSLQVSPDAILFAGEQLTDYQMLFDANKDRLGLGGINKLGFIELLKRKVPKTSRGKGPEIIGPSLVDARPKELLDERREKIAYLIEQIQAKHFFRRPGMAYNTPCDMCDFRDLCLHGSLDGLKQKPRRRRE